MNDSILHADVFSYIFDQGDPVAAGLLARTCRQMAEMMSVRAVEIADRYRRYHDCLPDRQTQHGKFGYDDESRAATVDFIIGQPQAWMSRPIRWGGQIYWGYGRSHIYVEHYIGDNLQWYVMGAAFERVTLWAWPGVDYVTIEVHDAPEYSEDFIELNIPRPALVGFMIDGKFNFDRINAWMESIILKVKPLHPEINWTPDRPRVLHELVLDTYPFLADIFRPISVADDE